MNKTVPRLVAVLGLVALLPTIAAPAFAYTGQKFAHEAKIGIEQARRIALQTHPGRIIDEELNGKLAAAGFAIRLIYDAVGSHRRSASTPRQGKSLKIRRKARTRTERLEQSQQTRPARCGAGFSLMRIP